jgi:hypothetical protein
MSFEATPVSELELNTLLRALIAQIEESIAKGEKLPWNSPFFLSTMRTLVNIQEKTDHDKTPCPEGRPYRGIVNSLFLVYGMKRTADRRGGRPDNRFVRFSSIVGKNPTYRLKGHGGKVANVIGLDKGFVPYEEYSKITGAVATPVFYPIKKNVRNKAFDPTQPPSAGNSETITYFCGWGVGNVVNVADTDLVELGYCPPLPEAVSQNNPPIEKLEAFICAYPHDYKEAECIPHYSLHSKTITMPPLSAAKSAVAYYATRCHEIAHMLQDMCEGLTMDAESYSRHELEAEMCAAYVLGSLGFINTESDEFKNSAVYTQTWLMRMKQNPKILFEAATAATRYGDLILKGKLPESIKNREKFAFLPKQEKVETA